MDTEGSIGLDCLARRKTARNALAPVIALRRIHSGGTNNLLIYYDVGSRHTDLDGQPRVCAVTESNFYRRARSEIRGQVSNNALSQVRIDAVFWMSTFSFGNANRHRVLVEFFSSK